MAHQDQPPRGAHGGHAAGGHAPAPDDPHVHAHPTWKQYKWVALILTLITVVEVWIYYIPSFVASKLWLWMTCILGATFLGFQAYEFTSFVHEGLSIRTNLFGSSFFTLTGFHGAHVTAGVIWLGTLLAIDYKRGLEPADAINVDIAALYWHFVDVVWIVIFTVVYLIQ